MKDIRDEFTSSISIKQPVAKKEVPGGDDENSRSQSESPFTQAELIMLWDEYADTLRNGFPHLFSTLKNFRPRLKEDWLVEFTLDNKVVEDELFQKKAELMEFLRSRLNNYKIRLETTVADTQRALKPYTDKEKFEKMAEKNPALRTLREELDLEIEY
jgi:DNA polymerase-3 subunit gamma/tau